MCVVGATTATRDTRPSASIRWAMCRPKVVLPAAGVAEARNASPEWSKTAAAAACCHARSGRAVGQAGRERPAARRGGAISYVTGGAKLVTVSDGPRRWTQGGRGPERSYRADLSPPTVYGLHQPGIATPQFKHAVLTAYDGDPREVLPVWTERAEEMMRAGGVTVTIGLDAVAHTHQRPLPAFPGEALDPRRCGGDLCALICSHEPITARLPGTPRWERAGVKEMPGALGFMDGVVVPRRPPDLERHVWVNTRDRTGMIGGTYLVVRDIEVHDSFRRLS